MQRRISALVVCYAAAAGCYADSVDAQWVLVAKRVIGRVQHMAQSQQGSASPSANAAKPAGPQPGYDVASVILDAKPQRIYATAVTMLKRHSEVQIVQQDAARTRIEFAQGPLVATMTVVPLGADVSQLIIASNTAPGPGSATSRVLDGVMNVCHAMKKHCTLAD